MSENVMLVLHAYGPVTYHKVEYRAPNNLDQEYVAVRHYNQQSQVYVTARYLDTYGNIREQNDRIISNGDYFALSFIDALDVALELTGIQATGTQVAFEAYEMLDGIPFGSDS